MERLRFTTDQFSVLVIFKFEKKINKQSKRTIYLTDKKILFNQKRDGATDQYSVIADI